MYVEAKQARKKRYKKVSTKKREYTEPLRRLIQWDVEM